MYDQYAVHYNPYAFSAIPIGMKIWDWVDAIECNTHIYYFIRLWTRRSICVCVHSFIVEVINTDWEHIEYCLLSLNDVAWDSGARCGRCEHIILIIRNSLRRCGSPHTVELRQIAVFSFILEFTRNDDDVAAVGTLYKQWTARHGFHYY